MGEDDERLVNTGRDLARLLVANGMSPDAAVLDVGCGYGRLALGLASGDIHRGSYVGFDILRKHVKWCQKNITAVDPRFRFAHIDARNERYNPSGAVDPDRVRFPVGPEHADLASVFSVFTHLHQSTIQHYLRELRRTLKPGAIAVSTWFLWDKQRLSKITADSCVYPMRYELDENTRYADATDPLHAIAYRISTVEGMITEAGLRIRARNLGSWDGWTTSSNFQDLLVIESPDPLARRVRRALRPVRRLVKSARGTTRPR